jgi:hypothetical protein
MNRLKSPDKLNQLLQLDQDFCLMTSSERIVTAWLFSDAPSLLDHECYLQPGSPKIQDSRNPPKYLLKRLMRDRLPSRFWQKWGLISGHDWLRRELKPLLLDVTRPSAFKDRDFSV